MITISVRIRERAPGRFDIVNERAETKGATSKEKQIAAIVKQAVDARINEIMAAAAELGAETSREVRHG